MAHAKGFDADSYPTGREKVRRGPKVARPHDREASKRERDRAMDLARRIKAARMVA